jgi:polyferredoxin
MSVISNRIWDAKPEKIPLPQNLIIESEMTIEQFGKANSLSDQSLKEIFDLKNKSDLENKISVYGNAVDISSLVTKKMALSAEDSSKNWKKIAVKFILWLLFLLSVFIYFKNHKVTRKIRNVLLFVSVLIFGIILGSDPSPMGTVKDAVYLFAMARTVFPPRMIALIIFLSFVFLANKYICAWGCQAGTLQELIFRLNRDDHNRPIILKQVKLPFVFTNSFRALFFIIFTFIAFLWSVDIIDTIDFFKIYKPEHIVLAGGVLTGILLTTSLFIYRPWCHLFCPFGLAGWLVEKISLVKINVDYGTCIACRKCSDACPSTVMSAILLKNKKTIPDCFACYTCRDVCPTGSIEFSARKRVNPPAGHFDKKNKMKGKN